MAESRQDEPAAVDGRIIISARVKPFENGAAHIFLEDISRADAPARELAGIRISGIRHPPAGSTKTIIPFRITLLRKDINPKNSYSLRVWIDINDDGKQGTDDLYSDRIYPVLTREAKNTAEILLDPAIL